MEFILTIDVEDWFQVENLREAINPAEWDLCEIRIIDNIKILLDLLEIRSVNATFFVLGWIAERFPKVVREIHEKGHEIASHGYSHKLIYSQSQKEFLDDLRKSKMILEDITGNKVIGYRAPSFSITDWAVEILKDEGFIYDSSYCPTSLHSRYGKLKSDFKNFSKDRILQFTNGLIEVALPTINILKLAIPWGGGAYFRLIPYSIFKMGIKRIVNQKKTYVFYFHPWEIDYEQPRIKKIRLNYKIRHYWGLKNAYNKLERLSKDFSFVSIKSYLENQIGGI